MLRAYRVGVGVCPVEHPVEVCSRILVFDGYEELCTTDVQGQVLSSDMAVCDKLIGGLRSLRMCSGLRHVAKRKSYRSVGWAVGQFPST